MSSSRVLVVQNDPSDPVARLGDWLRAAGLELDERRAWLGELPDDLTGFGGMIVLGGENGANDDAVDGRSPADTKPRAPFLAQVKSLLREALREEIPTLAVCLGSQLLAVAAGGRVEVGGHGPEIGAQLVAKRAAAATDPLFGPLAITPDVLQYHYDVITVLPPGAILLATSPVYENQAYRLGRLAWGVQFHIETTAAMVRQWVEMDPLSAERDVERICLRSDAAHDDIAEAWQPVAERFAEVVRNPDAVKALRSPMVATAAPVDDKEAIRAALAADMQAARTPPGSADLPMPAPYGRRPPPG